MAKGFRGKYFSLAAITATVSMVLLQAQGAQVEALEKVIVSASKMERPPEGLSDDFEVIDSEEIAQRGWERLDEALRFIGGGDLIQAGGPGQPVSFYLEGLPSDKTLILIDGIRYNDPTNLNGAALELLDLDGIDRIEIIRGPQSGVWGADAMAGVVNIITQDPKEGKGGWKVSGGKYETRSIHFALSNSGAKGYFGVSFDHLSSGGWSAYGAKPGEPLYGVKASSLPLEPDPFTSRRFIVKGGQPLGDGWFQGEFIKLQGRIHYDNFNGDAPDSPFTINEVDDTLWQLKASQTLGNHRLVLHYNHSNFQRSQFGGYEGSVDEVEWRDRLGRSWGGLQFGAGWQRFSQKMVAGAAKRDEYQNHYLFATSFATLGDLILQGSLRFDNYDRFDDRLTYKVGFKYPLTSELFMAANVATAYKAPSIFQLGYNATTNLDPEKGFGYNVIFGYGPFRGVYFKNRVKDLITWTDPDQDYTTLNDYYYNAPGTSTFQGYTLSFAQDLLDQFYLSLGYTHLSAKDAQGRRLPRRARERITYSLRWYVGERDSLDLSGFYVGRRFDVDGSKIGSYNVTDLTINHGFGRGIWAFVRVSNLFDRFYQEVAGYTSGDRRFYLGVRASY
ncbi:MAG: hypothetical protein C6I00_04725 [Nitratiruptor sp.]|nr:hypothetical protein [Nitratiruptor sp.]NPA84213.1 TonB-dependent receptor [Campylobacterota bacterium]